MGPLLLARLLELTEPQEGVLNIAFRWTEDERAAGDPKMAILDLQDLRSMIDEMGKRATELRSRYGNIAPATVGVLQRRLLVLEQQGAANFFGEPASTSGFVKSPPDGGVISILAAGDDHPASTPRSCVDALGLGWRLRVGDLEAKLVFLFDEATCCSATPPAVLDQIERHALIRSGRRRLHAATPTCPTAIRQLVIVSSTRSGPSRPRN
jgi:hypothetical protein